MRAALIFVGLWLSASSALASGGRDGAWSVEGTTDVGPCAPIFSGEIELRGDDIIGSNASGAKIIGAIDARGDVWARLTRPDGLARASGKLKGDTASGAWSSGTAYCGGRWNARRKH